MTPAPARRWTSPVPRHVDDAHGRGHLDGGGQGAQHDAPRRVAGARRRHAGQEEAHHDGVIVGAAHQGQQGQRVEDGEHERGARVAAERAGELGDAVGDQRKADDRLEPQQQDGDQRVMEAQRGRPAGEHEEERPVGSGGVDPEGIDPRRVGARAQRSRPVVVRVDVVAHHLALGRVGEHVPAEERGHDQERRQPQGEHVSQLADRDAGTSTQRLVQAEPHADEEDHAAVDGHDTGEHQRGRRPGGLAEEPGPPHLELERRARQRRAEADGQDGDEAQQRWPAQEGPVAWFARLRLDPLGQRKAAGEPEPRRVGPHGDATQARANPVQYRCCRRHRAFVHGDCQSRLSCPATTRRWEDPGSMGPQSI